MKTESVTLFFFQDARDTRRLRIESGAIIPEYQRVNQVKIIGIIKGCATRLIPTCHKNPSSFLIANRKLFVSVYVRSIDSIRKIRKKR